MIGNSYVGLVSVDPYAAAEGAEAFLILTEWNQFRALDLKRLAGTMVTPRTADLRNIYGRDDALAAVSPPTRPWAADAGLHHRSRGAYLLSEGVFGLVSPD